MNFNVTEQQKRLLEFPYKKYVKFFRGQHDSISHVRKYTNKPYFDDHCLSVAVLFDRLAKKHGYPKIPRQLCVIACLGHDFKEDVLSKKPESKKDYEEFLGTFGYSHAVDGIIDELTDVYTKENYPEFNRAKRKQLEAKRLSQVSNHAKLIKLCDLLHNTQDIKINSKKFFPVYKEEVLHLISIISAKGSIAKILIKEIHSQLV